MSYSFLKPLAVLFFLQPALLLAFPDGAPPEHSGANGQPSCKECHFGGMEGEPTLQVQKFSPMPLTALLANQNLAEKYGLGDSQNFNATYFLQLVAFHPQMKKMGIQLAVFPPEENVALLNCPEAITKSQTVSKVQYLTHRQPLTPTRQTVVLTCTLHLTDYQTNPLIGVAIVFSNDDLSAFGDDVETTVLGVTEE